MNIQLAQKVINDLAEKDWKVQAALTVYIQAIVDLERSGDTFLVDYGWSNVAEKREARPDPLPKYRPVW